MAIFTTVAALALLPAPIRTQRGGPPPDRPPWKPGYGDYCFRAECEIVGSREHEGARVVGYDRYATIADATEKACRLHVRGRGGSCTPPQLVMLPQASKECGGEIYVITKGVTTRLV